MCREDFRGGVIEMKKVLLFMLIFVMLFSVPAFASDAQEQESSSIEEGGEIQPRYKYIAFMSAGLNIDANGHAVFTGTACADYRNIRLSLYLQRSENSAFWDNIQGGIKTVYDNGGIEYERNLSAGDYFYRAKLVVEVLDSNKNVIETQTIYLYLG